MCQSCEALMINKVLCHETGCPDSWIDKIIECKECGTDFVPEEKWQEFCSGHCYCMYNNFECECDECQEFAEELAELDEYSN